MLESSFPYNTCFLSCGKIINLLFSDNTIKHFNSVILESFKLLLTKLIGHILDLYHYNIIIIIIIIIYFENFKS